MKKKYQKEGEGGEERADTNRDYGCEDKGKEKEKFC